MATKATGMSREFIIHPGEMIADIITDRGISQSELAKRTDVSEAYVSHVLTGKKGISTRFAMALEYALDIPKSFWLNLQANYDAERLTAEEASTVTDDERQVCKELKGIVKCLRKNGRIPVAQKKDEVILSLRKTLQISNLVNLGKLTPAGAFRLAAPDSVNEYVLGAWLRMCQISSASHAIQNSFHSEDMQRIIADVKAVMMDVHSNPQETLPRLFAGYGIDFSIVPNFKGAPVQGFICCKKDGIYQIVLTIRGAFADIFWFSLFHELGHIDNGDVAQVGYFMDTCSETYSERERKADQFAANALVDSDAYNAFIQQNDFRYPAISTFAATQNVPPYIVIGRLQKEKIIPYQWYSAYKLRYKWAD